LRAVSTRSNSAFAALLAHELADELAEPMHVLAQRTVLLREEDVGADRPGRR
jgi:hypothetical protein